MSTENLFSLGDEDVDVAAHFLYGVALYLALVDSLEAGIGGVWASDEVTKDDVLLVGISSDCGEVAVTRLLDVSFPYVLSVSLLVHQQ